MFNIGGGEVLVIALIALIVLGPQRLPNAARQAGKVMGDLRRISSGFQSELRTAFEDHERESAAPAITPTSPALSPADADVTESLSAIAAASAPVERAPAKRAPAKKGATKKASAKKVAAKQAPAPKVPTKRAPAKKAAAKKPAPAKKRSS